MPKSQTDLMISNTSSVFLNGSAVYGDKHTPELPSIDLVQMICCCPKLFFRWVVVVIFGAVLICLFAGHPDIR